MKQNKIFIHGRHALMEALMHAPRAVTKVYLDRTADSKLRALAHERGVPVAPLSEGLARSDMKSGTPHQGAVGQVSLFALLTPYAKFVENLKPTPDTSLVLLSGLEDPHNVGAIIRSAAGFGVSGILMPQKGQAPVSGAVVKVSAGMAFRVPLVPLENVEQSISDLRKRGFKVFALAGEGKRPVTAERFDAPSVFVLGNEGQGVPGPLKRHCDAVLSIPINPRCESLNVAASAAVVLFAWSSEHPAALKNFK